MLYNQSKFLSVLRKHLVIGQFSSFGFFSAFYWSPWGRKPHIFLVSFIKTSESYKVSLVTISWQKSYDSGILREDCGIIQGLPMIHTRFADWVNICVVYLLELTGQPLLQRWIRLCGLCIAAIASSLSNHIFLQTSHNLMYLCELLKYGMTHSGKFFFRPQKSRLILIHTVCRRISIGTHKVTVLFSSILVP